MIPVSTVYLDAEERANVIRCLESGWISGAGKFVEDFESRWAGYCGREFGVAVSSGSTALHLAVAALDLGPGDEVILPAFTIVACCNVVLQAGAVPVLVDADPDTWCMDARQVAERVTPRTRAIMPVHVYGHPVDMNPILDIARKHDLRVIEDAAEAHGAEYQSAPNAWARCGSFGDASIFSFYANKIITTGEGGMVLTDDAPLADRLRSLRNLAFGEPRYVHQDMGFSYRLSNLQAALGVAQIDRVDCIIAEKRRIAASYDERLEGLPLRLHHQQPWARAVHWMYGVVLEDERHDLEQVRRELHDRGIETRAFFVGMHEQPVFRRRGLFACDSFPVTEHLSRRGFYLPSGPHLCEAQIEQVTDALRDVLS